MRRVIRLGDPTSHGGKVASAAGNYSMMGKGVARVGDICTCPIKGHNNCTIAEGDPNWTIDGRAVALEGHKTSCGAVLISTLGNVTRSYEGDGAAGGINSGSVSSNNGLQDTELSDTEELEQFFVFVDAATGSPVNTLTYKVIDGKSVLVDKENPSAGETIRFPMNRHPGELDLIAWVSDK